MFCGIINHTTSCPSPSLTPYIPKVTIVSPFSHPCIYSSLTDNTPISIFHHREKGQQKVHFDKYFYTLEINLNV